MIYVFPVNTSMRESLLVLKIWQSSSRYHACMFIDKFKLSVEVLRSEINDWNYRKGKCMVYRRFHCYAPSADKSSRGEVCDFFPSIKSTVNRLQFMTVYVNIQLITEPKIPMFYWNYLIWTICIYNISFNRQTWL